MQMMVAMVMFVNHLSHYHRQWQLALPQLHCVITVSDLASHVANQISVLLLLQDKVLELCSCCVASVSKEGVMKHIMKVNIYYIKFHNSKSIF